MSQRRKIAFRVDEKVRCIMPDFGWSRPYGEAVPKLRATYTVRQILRVNGTMTLRLAEVRNPAKPYEEGILECAFPAAAFRPLGRQPALRRRNRRARNIHRAGY